MRSLYFDPFILSAYEDLKIGEGTDRHKHKDGEPCHLTIVAAGAVWVTTFGPDFECAYECFAPCVIDYRNGEDRDHCIKASRDGTTFYNIPRTPYMKQEAIASYLFEDG